MYVSGCLIKASYDLSGAYTMKKCRVVADYAFSGCTKITSITIPEGVTHIGFCAFDGCSNLTSITLPSTVKSIEWGAFINCDKLQTIYIPDGTCEHFAAMEGMKEYVDLLESSGWRCNFSDYLRK